MARVFYAGICLLLIHMLTVVIVKVDTKGYSNIKRQKREWIIPPRKLKENVDYRHEIIAKIRSDEETRTSIRYSLTGHGADKDPVGLFVVDPLSGDVRVTDILDREKVAVYYLQGMAKFANGSQAERNIDLRVIVIDENDNDPVFSIMEAGSVSELSQSGTLVMRITAMDADDPATPNALLTYGILEQIPGDAAMFYITRETGEVHVRQSTLDREMHSSYTLKVIGSDMDGQKGGRTSTGVFTINILDVNDNVPTLEKSYYEGSVEENTVNVEVMRIKAVDLDLVNTDNWRTIFSIASGNEAGYFKMTTDEKTNEGIITLIKALDYEELKEVNLRIAMHNKAAYHQSVVLAPGSSSYPIKVKVKNQVEGPRFSPVMKAISISENSKVVTTHTVIATYAAIDSDTLVVAGNVRYAKVHDPANWLIIDEKTAEIKLSQIPDRESKFLINGTYIAKIICITDDIPAKTATGTIFMEVEDFNDHCPTLTSTTATACSYDTAVVVTAEDADPDPNGAPFHFHIVHEGTKQEWTIEPADDNRSVILRAGEKLWPGLYQVELEVQDQQGKACDERQVLDVMVCSCREGGADGAEKACEERAVPSTVFGAPGVAFLLLPLLLLLLVPLLLLFCTCGGRDFAMMPVDTKEHLIEYHTERPGEDKEVPLLQIPTEVNGTIKAQHFDTLGAGQTVGGAAGASLAGAAGAGFEQTMGAGFEQTTGAGYGQALGAGFGGAGFGGAGAGFNSASAWGYGDGMHSMDMKRRYSGFESLRKGAWDGLALSEDFLSDYYSQKVDCAEIHGGQLGDGLHIYEYEGQESPTGSVGCCSLLGPDDNLDFLNNLDPKFKTLAEICRGSSIEMESSTTASAHGVHFGGTASSSTTTHAEILAETNLAASRVPPAREASSSTMTHTEITTETTLGANMAPPARVATPAHMVESVFAETSYAASVPRQQVTENVLASSGAYLVQPTPVLYTAAPVLQPTRYILEQPGLGATLLVTDRPRSAQGVYLVSDAPHPGQTVLVREQRGAAVPAGAFAVNEGVVLVEQRHVLREADPGRSHTFLHVESPGPGPQSLLVLERQAATESQSEPRQPFVQERSATASPNPPLVASQVAVESGHRQELHPGTSISQSHSHMFVEERSATASPNPPLVASQVAVELGHQQGASLSQSHGLLLEVDGGSTPGRLSPASQNSLAGEEGVSRPSSALEERAELQVVAPTGAHTVVRQEKQMSYSERSVQEITTSGHAPI